MSLKNKSSYIKPILVNLGIAASILAVAIFILFFYISRFTNHGEYIEVPNLKGKNINEAVTLLKYEELDYEIIDSVYFSDKPAGAIIEQIPQANEKTKRYRKIYLIINSYSKPLVTLPNLRDLSYRNAKATIEALGLIVANVEYVPWEYKDLVKDVKKDGITIEPGKRIPKETPIVLVVGRGQSTDEEIYCPSFRGLTLNEAQLIAGRDSLYFKTVFFTETPKDSKDSTLFFVYKQRPIKGKPIYFGASVSLWLTKDKSLLSATEEEYIKQKEDSIKKTQEDHEIDNWF